jgi:hypothetical protein
LRPEVEDAGEKTLEDFVVTVTIMVLIRMQIADAKLELWGKIGQELMRTR